MNVARRVVRVTKTRRAIRAEEEGARRAKIKARNIEMLLDGTRDRVLAETGFDLLAGTPFGPPLPKRRGIDGGAGRDDLNDGTGFDNRSPSQTLSDHIREIWNDPARREERERLKRGGSHDARDVPENAPAAVSYPRVPWER